MSSPNHITVQAFENVLHLVEVGRVDADTAAARCGTNLVRLEKEADRHPELRGAWLRIMRGRLTEV